MLRPLSPTTTDTIYEGALHLAATHHGLVVEWKEGFGYVAKLRGSRAFFTLGRSPSEALARFTLATAAIPRAAEA